MSDLTLVESLAARTLSKTDRRFWQLADDPGLGKADYGEFLFKEAVAVLRRFKTPDPEGHILLWLNQGYLYGSKSTMKDEHVVFGSTERGVFSLHVSETGKTIAKLGRPKER
jgi:hypothetical protein